MTTPDQPSTADRRPLASAEDVSKYLGIPVATLHQWRHRGTGPQAIKVGRWLRYRWTDVDSWLESQAGWPS